MALFSLRGAPPNPDPPACDGRASSTLPIRPCKTTPLGVAMHGGEGEIRTRGELPHDGFQDRYLKPLGHLSIRIAMALYQRCVYFSSG